MINIFAESAMVAVNATKWKEKCSQIDKKFFFFWNPGLIIWWHQRNETSSMVHKLVIWPCDADMNASIYYTNLNSIGSAYFRDEDSGFIVTIVDATDVTPHRKEFWSVFGITFADDVNETLFPFQRTWRIELKCKMSMIIAINVHKVIPGSLRPNDIPVIE